MRTRSGSSWWAARFFVAAAVALGSVCAATRASAHPTPPFIVTTVDSVTPALPSDVQIVVRPSVAEELVVSNPTPTVLTVLSTAGEPFLQISKAGVLGNLSSPDWWLTNDPLGALHIPATAKVGAKPQWVPVSTSSVWAWFDHRMHPSAIVIPYAMARGNHSALLSRWSVPMEYGKRRVTVRGRVDYQPVRGGWYVALDPSTSKAPQPRGVTAQILQGPLPGVLLTSARAHQAVTVLGADGTEFAQIGPSAVYVNESSPTWIADQQARGIPPALHPSTSAHVADGNHFAWLDTRLSPPSMFPSADVLNSSRATIISHWSIPVGGQSLHGTIQWLPSNVAAGVTGAIGSVHGPDHGVATVLIVVGILVLSVGGVVLQLRRLKAQQEKSAHQ